MRTRLPLVLLSLLLFGLPRHSRAQTPVSLWGLARGCEPQINANKQAERLLQSATQRVALVQTPAGKALPPCQGARCGQIFHAACPHATGRVLGGQVMQGGETTRFRLWLYDLQTGQTAFQDDFTQNPGIADAFVAQAQALLQAPVFGVATPGTKPTYCDASAVRSSLSAGPLFLTVFGEGKFRAQLHEALTEQLGLLGHKPLPLPGESRRFSKDVLVRAVAGQQNARVLGAEINKDGSVRLFLFDQVSALTYDRPVICAACEGAPSAERFIPQIKQEVASVLEHCFSTSCAKTGLVPPVEACTDFAEQTCPGLQALIAPQNQGLPMRHIDPTTAKLVYGGIWGLFAASSAAAIGLGVADLTSAGVVSGNGGRAEHVLLPPALVSIGTSAALLGVAIPTTLLLRRAERTSLMTGGAAQTPGIQCQK